MRSLEEIRDKVIEIISAHNQEHTDSWYHDSGVRKDQLTVEHVQTILDTYPAAVLSVGDGKFVIGCYLLPNGVVIYDDSADFDEKYCISGTNIWHERDQVSLDGWSTYLFLGYICHESVPSGILETIFGE